MNEDRDRAAFPRASGKGRLTITLDDLEPQTTASNPSPRVAGRGSPTAAQASPALPAAILPAIKPTPTAATYCRACGNPLDSRAMMCPRCGVATRNATDAGVAAAALAMNHKSPGMAMVLSLLFTGAGQVYCGKVGRGIAFFLAAVFSAVLILAVIGLILLPIIWIWAMVDAYQLAIRQNQALLATVQAGD